MLLAWVAFCGVLAQKAIIYGRVPDSVKLPPFRESFQALARNRAVYNRYNDSIFQIKNHQQWVSFFRRRAVKNHQIFASNKVLLGNIFDYFKRDTVYSQAYYNLFVSYFHDYRSNLSSDPFLTLEVCKILDSYNALCPDSVSMANIVNLWLGEAYSQIGNLGSDALMYKKSCQYYQRIMKDDAPKYGDYLWAYPHALWQLSTIAYLQNKSLTIEEHNQYLEKLKAWYQEHQNDSTFGKSLRQHIGNVIRTDAESLLRNIYMADSTVMEKPVADSMMQVVVKRNLANEKLTLLSYARTLTLQVKLGQITAAHAVDLYLERHKNRWKDFKNKNLTSQELASYVQPLFSVFYLNDISDASHARRRKVVKRLCQDIEWAYVHRQDQQQNTNYVKSLNNLTTYERISKYLTPKERVHFLNSLNVATQVTTYAHSVHVSMIAEVLMEGVVKYRPELLEGTLGYEYVQDIKKNQKVFVNFAHDAAMYHDLGKNSIIFVVNNDYRPLTDEEFAIIKRHPELGLQYLELSPELAKFHDTTLGHHKWYNGKGGYPASFDNTKSPMRIMIDIVTLSDCMQAATERVGRNYKGDKTFDIVMGEFRRDAGIRYNPDLVKLIDAHPDLAEKLADLINDGWVDIYYNIYSEFMAK